VKNQLGKSLKAALGTDRGHSNLFHESKLKENSRKISPHHEL